jgi:translation initiation factor 2B subunit (eIF-2B alpha/beta/delta family)
VSKDAEELKKAAQEASRKLSEAAQEVMRQSLPIIQEHAQILTKEMSEVARKFASEQGPALRAASRRAVEEFRKALDEELKKRGS